MELHCLVGLQYQMVYLDCIRFVLSASQSHTPVEYVDAVRGYCQSTCKGRISFTKHSLHIYRQYHYPSTTTDFQPTETAAVWPWDKWSLFFSIVPACHRSTQIGKAIGGQLFRGLASQDRQDRDWPMSIAKHGMAITPIFVGRCWEMGPTYGYYGYYGYYGCRTTCNWNCAP